jgi:hypothetical protein
MKPFTYYLYHKPTGLKYYGTRYSKQCDPTDLWTTYFTSSSLVKELIKAHGADSFVFKVRKIFETPEQALLWEHKFLSKINAAENPEWLNRHNGGSKFKGPSTHTQKTIEKFRKKLIGEKRSDEAKENYRNAAKKREELKRQSGWRMPSDFAQRMVSTRKERIEQGIINPYSAERNAKMSETKKGTRRHYLPDGSFIMVRPQDDQ